MEPSTDPMKNDDRMVAVSGERQSLRQHSLLMHSISPNGGDDIPTTNDGRGGDRNKITPPSPKCGRNDDAGYASTPSSPPEEDHAFTSAVHSLLLQECPTPIKKQKSSSGSNYDLSPEAHRQRQQLLSTTLGSPFTPIGRRMMNELSINSPSLYPMQQLTTPTRKQPAYGSPAWSSSGRNMTPIVYQRGSDFKPLRHSFDSPFVVAAQQRSEGDMSTLDDSSLHSSSSITSLTLDRSYSSLWVPLTVLTKDGSSLGVALPPTPLTALTLLRSIDVDQSGVGMPSLKNVNKNKKLETSMTAPMVTEPRRILPPKIRPRTKSPTTLFHTSRQPPLLEVDIGLQLELSDSLRDGYSDYIKAELYRSDISKQDEEQGRESEDAEIMALLTQYNTASDDTFTSFPHSPLGSSCAKRPMPTITLHHKHGETIEHDTKAATKSFLPCPIPVIQPGKSRSMFDRTTKNDPIEGIILADAIAEAAKCEQSLTDDEASHHSDFLLSLPSDAAEQKITRRMSVSALQDERRKRFSFKPRMTPPPDNDMDEHVTLSVANEGIKTSLSSPTFCFGTPSFGHNLQSDKPFEGSSSDSDNDNDDIIQSPPLLNDLTTTVGVYQQQIFSTPPQQTMN